MDKAIELVAPHLQEHGIILHFVAIRSLRKFIRSVAKVLIKEKQYHFDFILYNSLASLTSRISFVSDSLFSLLRITRFIYWRELGMVFEEIGKRFPDKIKIVNCIANRKKIKHLANSVATQEFILSRYNNSNPVNVYNCGYVSPQISRVIRTPCHPPVVINIGSIQYKKGPDLFVETAIKVCKIHPTVEFIWLGEGELDGDIVNMIEREQLLNRIIFTGFVDSPHLLLAKAKIFFLSSRQESFSQAVAEAMCLGRNIVAFENVGGPVELLGGHGNLVPAFNTDKASDTVVNLLNKSDEEMNTGARQRYFEMFTPGKHAERLYAY
jgi:glycosyltransferase involved in cell wall biosynthesis